MRDTFIRASGAVAALAVAASFAAPAGGSGSAERRGGDHGCNTEEGTFFSNHWWDAGDKISFGIAFEPGSPLPPGSPDQDVLKAENKSGTGEGPISLTCGADVGSWQLVTSDLGPGDDQVRFDAKGLETEKGQSPYGPLPKSVSTEVSGGGGDDTLRGHKGFDNIRAGSGADIVKADDGRADNVNCGTGRDKADVDSKDDLKSCEQLS